ncbi:uncharacterized protein LOC135839193 [Planococcus citri]|uniref:uncharacterized protein LOC135839193 n=1 Tax=Planococcus citri TaxID=170843 RepID=UPI0031F7FF76
MVLPDRSKESDYASENWYRYTFGYKLEDYNPDKVEERPTSAPTLQKIATVKAAIALWNRACVEIGGFTTQAEPRLRSPMLFEIFLWVDLVLPVPKSIANSIQNYVRRIDETVRTWACHISEAVFLNKYELKKAYEHVNCIYWNSNETINLLETARNLLKSDKLNTVDKFHVASTYCLQEEVEKIWQTFETIDRLFDGVHEPHQLSLYWAGKFDKSLPEDENLTPINVLNALDMRVSNWPAIEYIFNQLNSEQQVTKAVDLIEKFGLRYQKLILMKLNESQRVSVFEKYFIIIVPNYANSKDNDEEDAIFESWYEFRNFITGAQFGNLISVLLLDQVKESIIIELWNTAPDYIKNYSILNSSDYVFFQIILRQLQYVMYMESHLFNLISSVLSYCDSVDTSIKRKVTKARFFIVICLKLCRRRDLELLDGLLSLFHVDAAESTEYKQFLVSSSYFNIKCQRLITRRHFDSLFRLLDFRSSILTDSSSTQFLRKMLSENMQVLNNWCLKCYSVGNLKYLNADLAPLRSSYPEIVSEYKKNLLLSDEGLQMCVNRFVSKDLILPRIIADGLPIDLAAEFKRKIISSPQAIDKLKRMMVKKRSNTAMKLIDWYIESESDRKTFKQAIEDAVREMTPQERVLIYY